MANIVQLNVRMDQSLRDAGNAALSSKRLSPSVFVRAAWEKLAQRGESLEVLLDAVFGKAEQAKEQSPVESGQLLYTAFVRDVGLEGRALDATTEGRSFGEITEDSIMERWRGRGLGGE